MLAGRKPRALSLELRAVLLALALALVPAVGGHAAERAATAPPVAATQATMGPAIAIGGALRDDNAAVWTRLIELAGGPGARFVVLATASGDPQAAAQGTVAALVANGAVAEHLPVAPELKGVDNERAVRDPALIAKVRAANGVFFTGGDQARIVDTLRPGGVESPLLLAIRELQRRGGVVVGTSAGAAIMSRTMFRDPASVITLLKGPVRKGIDDDAGLGFAQSELFVDQHFLRRGRLGRMLALMQARDMTLGLGVEEDAAAVLRGDTIEVLGAAGAMLVDLSEATTDPRASDFQPYHDDAPLALDVLAGGVVIDRMVRVVDGKSTEARGLAFDPSPDAAAPRNLGFEFSFIRRPDTLAWYDPVPSADAYTIANVRLDVVPVRVAQPLFEPWQR